jgi:hypothetical protein
VGLNFIAVVRSSLLAEEETVLQGIIDRLIGIGRCRGMEMNVEKLR